MNRRIVQCQACPRLVMYLDQVTRHPRRSYRDQRYHGRAVANFLCPHPHRARLLIVGLAPAAHGANRTGRMFTGDRSGDFLFHAMHATGWCNQPHATHQDDGLKLIDCVITAAVHCAPPSNKPTVQEQRTCEPFLEQTFDAMPRLKAVLCLGKLAMEAIARLYVQRRWLRRQSQWTFGHGAELWAESVCQQASNPAAADSQAGCAPVVLCSYHPSQQNTFTGRLTQDMLQAVLRRAGQICDHGLPPAS